jgi:hypothetical protein
VDYLIHVCRTEKWFVLQEDVYIASGRQKEEFKEI